MRSSLLITIVVMSLLSVGFTLFTGEVYLRQTLENRRDNFTEVTELEVHNLWDKLKQETQALGLGIQADKDFRRAFSAKNKTGVVAYLDEHYDRAFVTLGILELKKLIVFDKKMNQIFQSKRGDRYTDVVCPSLIENAKKRQGSERFKTLNKACGYRDEVRLATLVPVGGLRLKGYLMVVVDPVINLSKAEKGLGIPLQINTVSGKTLFQSEEWPDENTQQAIMWVHYANKAGNKKPVLDFHFASDVTDLKANLSRTRVTLISFVLVTTMFVMFVALALFRKTIISPLDKINVYLGKIRSNRRHLNEKLTVSGSKELVNLAQDMNVLNKELAGLYTELEELAFTDSLTGIPNRALFFDRLEQITLLARRDKEQPEFMLMMLDLNKFKQVNDELGHKVGDELLKAVAGRLKQALRVTDTVARIGGDEFAVILYAVNEKSEAAAMAEKISALIKQPFEVDGHQLNIGTSIGIAGFPNDAESSNDLMHCADMAMYHSKRNQLLYVFFDDGIPTDVL